MPAAVPRSKSGAAAPAVASLPALAAVGRRVQEWLGRRAVGFLARRGFGFQVEIAGAAHIPAGEPLIVAGGPHRSWLDPFLTILAFPAPPRLCFLGSTTAMFDTWWKRVVLGAFGGVVAVDLSGPHQHHRAGLDASLAILARGDRLGVFPEGPGLFTTDPTVIHPYKRGIAYLSQRSGRRVIPVAIAGTQTLWRGKTLRLAVGAPLPALAPDANRAQQLAWLEQLHAATVALLPPQPPMAPPAQRRGSGLTAPCRSRDRASRT